MKNRIVKSSFALLLSLLIPAVILIVALVGLHVTPFGDRTLVISDANGLYINYFGYIGRFLKGMEGFTYSFRKGLGGNMMPHMNGSFSNPTFALAALVEAPQYPMLFTWIVVINFGLCGLTMYLLLADIYGHKRSNLIFSTCYALSGFMVANVFQIIFFIGPLMLPLVALGLRKLLQGKSPLLYILSLGFIIVTNLYFGFVMCITSVLIFFTTLWCERDALKGRKLKLFIHYAIASLCSGLLGICVWLPSFMGLMGGRLDKNTISDLQFIERMPFIEIFTKLFTGSNNTNQLVNGLPNIFVTLLPVVLVILFFMNRKIDRRRKAVAGFILAFFLLGFYILAFDMLLHGGTTTNWFNHRYSYVFSFMLLMIAACEWQYLEDIDFRDLKRCFVGMLIATAVIFSKRYDFVMGGEVVLDLGLLALIFLAYRMYRLWPEHNPKRTFETVALLVACFSLFLNLLICTQNIMDWGQTESEYRKTVETVDPLVKGIQTSDHSFYRMEINQQRSGTLGNDPLLYGYNGVGHGGSVERDFVREELNKLGIQWFDMRNYYAQGIPAATDALLGLKYLIADEDMTSEKNYTRITDLEKLGLATEGVNFDLYQSGYELPIAFVTSDTVDSLVLSYDDVFDNLNRVWDGISSSDRPVFVEEDDIHFTPFHLIEDHEMSAEEVRAIVKQYEQNPRADEDALVSSSGSASGSDELVYKYFKDEKPQFLSSIEYSWVAKRDGPVYVYHRTPLSTSNGSMQPVLHYLGYYHAGDTVKGYLTVDGEYITTVTFEEFCGRFRAAYADLDALEALSEIVRQRPSEIVRVKENHLTGSFTVEKGQKLLFTIPWDAGWTCTIDGQEAGIEKVLGVFMAVDAAPGEHTFEMKYAPLGMDIGLKISIGTLIFTLLYLAFIRRWLDRLLSSRAAKTPA